ncbi:glycosyltransferase [Methylobacterium sp. E-005]|uniref:glycosyltransferase n=1 Tax=Methylobacterium sp. E-005 TaxID=2836549 RepID=UPI001FBA31E3|nr:glycosyltransferase [Methylobacterium sp. E-005]MCJ2085391.1 glycosyltransferase [Methylobacterium sp. E-005]
MARVMIVKDLTSVRIVLSTFGSHGDVLPFIALGAELAARGHDVSVVTSRNFEAHVIKSGLGFHALCSAERMDEVHANPHLWHPTEGLRLMFDLAVELAPTDLAVISRERAEAGARGRPFLAVAGPLSFGARMARDAHRFPLITTYLAPFLMRSRHAPPELPGMNLPSWLPSMAKHALQRIIEHTIVDPARLPALNNLRRSYGLSAIGNLSDWLPSPDHLLLMAPPWFAQPQSDWPKQATQVAFPHAGRYGNSDQLSQELHDFLNHGPAPVVITCGSSMQHGRKFFEAAAHACAEAGQRAVLVCGRPERVAAIRVPNQLIARYAPFGALFRRSKAVIHHGGIGTCSDAFAAGIPQIVVPNGFDQGDNAERIAKLGLGSRLNHEDLSEAGADILARILADSAMAKACARVRELCAGRDGIADACDLIEAAARREPAPPNRLSRPSTNPSRPHAMSEH